MVVIHKKNEQSKEEKEQQKLMSQRQRAGIRDEFQAKGFELVSFVQKHKAIVSAVIVLFFFIGIAFSLYLFYQQRTKEAASNAYLEAIKLTENDDDVVDSKNKDAVNKSIEALKKVAADYKNTKIARLANLYAADLCLKENQAALSVKLYESAILGLKESDDLYPLSLMGLGYALEMDGKVKESQATFEKILSIKDNYALEISLWEAARLASINKETDKAKEYLRRLKEEFPSSSYERNAKRLSDSLK